MANGWSTERQARQALAIRRWRPWDKATGPKSQEGKATAAKNALKHGAYSAEGAAIRALLGRLS